jgi:hypothetical protein
MHRQLSTNCHPQPSAHDRIHISHSLSDTWQSRASDYGYPIRSPNHGHLIKSSELTCRPTNLVDDLIGWTSNRVVVHSPPSDQADHLIKRPRSIHKADGKAVHRTSFFPLANARVVMAFGW